jgi:hypothetical protein
MAKNNPFTHQIIHFKTRDFPHIKYFALITLLLFLSISTAGCVTLADPEASQEYWMDKPAWVKVLSRDVQT